MDREIIDYLSKILESLNFIALTLVIYLGISVVKKISDIFRGFRSEWDDRWRKKAANLFERAEYNELLSHCDSELKSRPNSPMRLWWMARAYQSIGRDEDAISCFKKVLILEPKWASEHVGPYYDQENASLRSS